MGWESEQMVSTWPFWWEWVSGVPFLLGVAIAGFGLALIRYLERLAEQEEED